MLEKNNLYVGIPLDHNGQVIQIERGVNLCYSKRNGLFLGAKESLLSAGVSQDYINAFENFVEEQSVGNEGERVIISTPREVVIDIWEDGFEIINYDSLESESLHDVFEATPDWAESYEKYVTRKFKELIIAAL